MKERIIPIDVLRLIAMISVIIMHCTGAIQRYYFKGIDLTFLLTNIPNAITRFAVPLFVMISGRLMINRGHDYKYLIRKIGHYMGVFFFWSLIYSLVLIELPSLKEISIKALIANTLIDTLSGWFHFWFLFLICGIYAILPIIEIIVNNIPAKILRYYVCLNIIIGFFGGIIMSFPSINNLLGDHFNSFLVGFLNIYTFYFMLGYWLKDAKFRNKHFLLGCLILGMILNGVIGNYSSWIAGDRVVYLIDAQSPCTLLVCVCLYLLVNQNIKVIDEKKRKIIIELSELSFGVYLCHMLIIESIKKGLSYISNPLIACLATISTTVVLSYCLSWILWKNKITRRIVK